MGFLLWAARAILPPALAAPAGKTQRGDQPARRKVQTGFRRPAGTRHVGPAERKPAGFFVRCYFALGLVRRTRLTVGLDALAAGFTAFFAARTVGLEPSRTAASCSHVYS